ncbi:LOW QUALITY PROTEIN: hypothetical protein Smp_163800 [Schistosoma mansoni]|uniref:hypothetical protein n=1 Tax=Schistosoma mansoni TaxID=6183 RepID=UPI00022DC9FB|nr:LOW QUALITY PROTEIN: hypothetical protein Smp_163800 [Schistosoma mansoni]|eukprot:XP_018655672.1 LOW QUALITY PROTEIN: hypothetical protein Smp_163800 [Schistosoma mansoni]
MYFDVFSTLLTLLTHLILLLSFFFCYYCNRIRCHSCSSLFFFVCLNITTRFLFCFFWFFSTSIIIIIVIILIVVEVIIIIVIIRFEAPLSDFLSSLLVFYLLPTSPFGLNSLKKKKILFGLFIFCLFRLLNCALYICIHFSLTRKKQQLQDKIITFTVQGHFNLYLFNFMILS